MRQIFREIFIVCRYCARQQNGLRGIPSCPQAILDQTESCSRNFRPQKGVF